MKKKICVKLMLNGRGKFDVPVEGDILVYVKEKITFTW